MVSDKANFDLKVDFDIDNDYKSCFARSVAVNSKFKSKLQRQQQQQQHSQKSSLTNTLMDPRVSINPDIVKLRKKPLTSIVMDENRRLSCSSIISSKRTSICSSRISEIPVESIANQSKVETLQWQLKETEKSREMYKAVMKQVVTFLERAHRSLELLGNKINTKQTTVPRSKSEHQIDTEDSANENFSTFRDYTWRSTKKPQSSTEEIPPEKLSQEAFRLLRTAQSLLNTQEPKLAQLNSEPIDDIEFLSQLVKEFPQTPETRPQRTTSFSLSPKLLTPDVDLKISTAFNRKLSLQLNETRRNLCKDFSKSNTPINGEILSTSTNVQEKSNSPPIGSISSVEDESGFSSMNSFQDVGLPNINTSEEIKKKNILLKSMIHDDNINIDEKKPDDIILWKKPESISHKRWNSSPYNTVSKVKQSSIKVLWV